VSIHEKINEALRTALGDEKQPINAQTLRRILREEIPKYWGAGDCCARVGARGAACAGEFFSMSAFLPSSRTT
jgi:hypothetical protein